MSDMKGANLNDALDENRRLREERDQPDLVEDPHPCEVL